MILSLVFGFISGVAIGSFGSISLGKFPFWVVVLIYIIIGMVLYFLRKKVVLVNK